MDSYIDWMGCELVERIPGKVSGRPIVRGTVFSRTQSSKMPNSALRSKRSRRTIRLYRLRPFSD